ncbi:tail fiber domain-containing protein [Emticicia sp. BO119]|uniref:tail fiber domain-containing protein n=1 Tax=Emticicia sp. BO119 TaxID=2757768 RepID=UPI0015F0A36C|nr:tail fiber domain-containing protein [Emticicia sp. BO119]MBA4851477.1 tail fiber domain-containing protein [Emticicia sp. BO119]
MKKTFLLILCLLVFSQLVIAQTVTLATTTANPTKGTVYFNNSTNQLQYWNGTAWLSITNAASATGWALNGTNIYKTNTGNVGIGTSTPGRPLTVVSSGIGISQETADGETRVGFYTSSGGAYVQTHTPHDLKFATDNSSTKMILQHSTGNFGVGTSSPTNKLQVGSVGPTGFAGNHIAFGNGTHAGAFYQSSTTSAWVSSVDIVLRPRYPSGGYVGINVANPANLLQIGSMGSTGYAGNDIAFGNGTNAAGISQSNGGLSIASTTDILFRANNNSTVVGIGGGRVGINTLTPRGPLDVIGSSSVQPPFIYLKRNSNTGSYTLTNSSSDAAAISIYAEWGVCAIQFVAISDARIKNVVGISNSEKDLATIRALEITDYTMKDYLQHGNKVYKKVIAQQVEKVYPQAVSKDKDIIPDIYTLAQNVVFDQTNKTLKCTLAKPYAIKVGEKLQFIHPEKGKLKAEVIEVSGNGFTVKDWEHPTDNIFVYGREVTDFRSVDYEAISMLGISAIQQLAKENDELKTKNKETDKRIELLTARMEALEAALGAQLGKAPTGK